MSNTRDAMLFSHKTNIERYKRILETHLTADERALVERRLTEEKIALKQIADTMLQ